MRQEQGRGGEPRATERTQKTWRTMRDKEYNSYLIEIITLSSADTWPKSAGDESGLHATLSDIGVAVKFPDLGAGAFQGRSDPPYGSSSRSGFLRGES